MGDYNTIYDVGTALMDFLSKHSEDHDSFKKEDFTLSPPEKSSKSSVTPKPKISIYLYRIIENTNLRDEEQVSRIQFENNNPEINIQHRIFLSLFYLITPLQTEDNEKNIQENYNHLGRILQIFSQHRNLTDDILPPNLKGEKIRIYLNPISLDDLNKIWSIISKDELYKLSISIEVSPVRIDSEPISAGARVKERDLAYYKKEEELET